MSERGLFYECIPAVIGLMRECAEMDTQQYEEWKEEVSEAIPAAARAFMDKVFRIIDARVGCR